MVVKRFVAGQKKPAPVPPVFASRHRDHIEATKKQIAAVLRAKPKKLAQIVTDMGGDPSVASTCARVRMTIAELAEEPTPRACFAGVYRWRTYTKPLKRK